MPLLDERVLPKSRDRPSTLLIVSQVYVPDPAAVGQQMACAAAEMVRRGFRVIVYTSARGFDDPSQKYPRRELRDGVEIRRLPLSSFGKSSIPVRLLGAALFVAQCCLRGLFVRSLRGILVSTSPPVAPAGVLFLSAVRQVPFTFWVMDLNPDQAVALEAIKPTARSARLLDWLIHQTLRRAAQVVALDRFMAARLTSKHDVGERLTGTPPWPLQAHLEPVGHQHNPFRRRHELEGRFVVMHSGNIGVSAPLATVLPAAIRLRDRKELVFVFVGGGTAKAKLEALVAYHQLDNVRLLPYQPLATLRYSLSAADIHLISLADELVGICHPCKAYGALAVAKPILYIGPSPSHFSDLLKTSGTEAACGWHIDHGDVDGLVGLLERLLATSSTELETMGSAGRRRVETHFGERQLTKTFCDVVEKTMAADADT